MFKRCVNQYFVLEIPVMRNFYYQLSSQCIRNRDGVPGEVVYDDIDIPIRQEMTCEPPSTPKGHPDTKDSLSPQNPMHLESEDPKAKPPPATPTPGPSESEATVMLSVCGVKSAEHLPLSTECITNRDAMPREVVYAE